MEDKKYYTPAIEDIRVGYECEWNTHADPTQIDQFTRWTHHVFTVESLENYGIECMRKNMKHFRTLYLTREQIEAEGWTHTGGNLSSVSRQDYEKSGVEIEYWELNQNLVVKRKNLYRDGSGRYDGYIQYFKGKCPSINEFRTICKLLNIK